jgi:hypothetical protein
VSIKMNRWVTHRGNGKGILMRKYSRFFVYFVVSIFIFVNFSFSPVKSVDKPNRIISIVYDDSNSMLENQKTTWSHAKYALQVFSALLEENDELSVFLMSSFLPGSNRTNPDIMISGRSGSRVSELLNGMTARDTGGTPFRSVQVAYEYLRKSATADDEKWLIILTDGDFNDNPNLNEEYNKYISKLNGLKILTLAIGPDVDPKKLPVANNSTYVYKANVDEEVTLEIANIAKRVFNRAELSNLKSFELGIPVSEIIVFAQGDDVKVELGNLSGAAISKRMNVEVGDADIPFATSNSKYVGNIRAATLRGQLVYITPASGSDFIDIQKNVTLDITGSSSIRIYYKPKVEIEVYLSKPNGERVEDDRIHSGSYTINANIMYPNDPTKTSLIDLNLLGNLQFEFEIINNDKVISCGVNACRVGSTISIERGTLDVKVVGRYLTYNTISEYINFKVLAPPQPVTLTINKKNEGYILSNIENEQPIEVEISQDGVIISKEKWDLLHLEDVHVTGGSLEYEVIKSDVIGILYIYPKYKNGDPYLSQNKDFDLNIDVSFLYDEGINEGKITEPIGIIDDLSSLDRFIDFLRKHGIKLLIFVLTIIYIIGMLVKPRFLRGFKRGYRVVKEDEYGGDREENKVRAIIKRKYIPFVAERAILKVRFRDDLAAIPKLRLEATKSGTKLLNYKEFIDDARITINGKIITDDRVKKGTCNLSYVPSIVVKIGTFSYRCNS